MTLDLYIKKNQGITSDQQYHQRNNQDGENIFDIIQDKFDNFFSKGYNIIRLLVFIIIMIYLLFSFISAMASLPDGESMTLTFFFKYILQNFKDLRENIPIFEYLFTKISNLISAKQVNFLIFLSSMLVTVLLLVCFCP